jgi:hypothetical protein
MPVMLHLPPGGRNRRSETIDVGLGKGGRNQRQSQDKMAAPLGTTSKADVVRL